MNFSADCKKMTKNKKNHNMLYMAKNPKRKAAPLTL